MSASFSVAAVLLKLLATAAGPELHLPDASQLAAYQPPETTRIYAADGSLLREYYVENRVVVPLSALPPYLVQAFISAEDQNFRRHHGVDPAGLARAMVANVHNLRSGRRLEGGSTITQQVAKNLLLTNEVSALRKIRELVLAFEIERDFSKDQILEMYLNEIYLGRGAYGIGAASARYFGKPPVELSLSEAAFLAALPKAPNNYNPVTRPEAARNRRDYVLDRMAQDGAITADQAAVAKAEPLAVRAQAPLETVHAPYFAEEVRRSLRKSFGNDQLYRGGLAVRTTLDPRLQVFADRALRAGLERFDRNRGWRGPITNISAMLDLPASAQAVAQAEAAQAPAQPAATPPAQQGRLLGALSAMGVHVPEQDHKPAVAPTAAPKDERPVWQRFLTGIDRPAEIDGWDLAVVLEVDRQAAVIGLEDGSQGRIDRSDLTWARRVENGRMGRQVGGADDVLAKGDVVWVQPAAAKASAPALAAYSLRQVPEVSGALVAIEPFTGKVLAMSGGFDFSLSEFNRATQAQRQPGSAFKPFVYLSALQHGYTPSSLVYDTPISVDQGQGVGRYRPRNYGGGFIGLATLRSGVERSRNVMTVRLLVEMGLQPVKDTAESFGIYQNMPLYPAMGLGAGETTPLKLTTAYATIANGGYQLSPYLIERVQDRDGRSLRQPGVTGPERADCVPCAAPAWSGQPAPQRPRGQALDDPIANYQMISILQGVTQRGTAARLAGLGLPLAGKTGTTNDSNDVWFVGFSPKIAVGIFVGYDKPRSLGAGATGGSIAVPIFSDFIKDALAGGDPGTFAVPPGVSFAYVDRRNGYAAEAGGSDVILEAFRPGTEPGPPPVTDTFGETSQDALTGTGGLY
ncbi:MAG: PBP1A family penicillin-binding protein [Inquilinus limosus]|uniref:Penicillin-binding protein 1A n=1 Tax=Inquilinus limosus TaxID=171674 RepID=A0A952FPT7_9PROT|nr:PBP1A family penicillin-binding protein [Inquilinus limosus]